MSVALRASRGAWVRAKRGQSCLHCCEYQRPAQRFGLPWGISMFVQGLTRSLAWRPSATGDSSRIPQPLVMAAIMGQAHPCLHTLINASGDQDPCCCRDCTPGRQRSILTQPPMSAEVPCNTLRQEVFDADMHPRWPATYPAAWIRFENRIVRPCRRSRTSWPATRCSTRTCRRCTTSWAWMLPPPPSLTLIWGCGLASMLGQIEGSKHACMG